MTLLSLIKFLKYLIPGAGLLSLIPSIGKIVATIVESSGPLLKAISEGLVWFVKRMWEGLCDVIDNVYTVMFVAVLCAGFFVYGDKRSDDECHVKVTKLEAQVKALRKNPVKTVPSNSNTIWPFDWFIR